MKRIRGKSGSPAWMCSENATTVLHFDERNERNNWMDEVERFVPNCIEWNENYNYRVDNISWRIQLCGPQTVVVFIRKEKTLFI